MPERSKGPQPWFRCARRSSDRRITHGGTWLIRDGGGYSESIRCRLDDRRGDEQVLSNYIVRKQVTQAVRGKRDAASVAVADVRRWRSERNDDLVAGALGACSRCRRAKLIFSCPPEHPLSFRARWGLRSYAFRLTHGTGWLIAKNCRRLLSYQVSRVGNGKRLRRG